MMVQFEYWNVWKGKCLHIFLFIQVNILSVLTASLPGGVESS